MCKVRQVEQDDLKHNKCSFISPLDVIGAIDERRKLSGKLPCKVREGLLKVVVSLGRDFVALQVLRLVECDLFALTDSHTLHENN
jgi:hypothetical protein